VVDKIMVLLLSMGSLLQAKLQDPCSLTSEYGKRNAGGEVLAIRSSERIDETFSGLAFRTILAPAFGLENVSAI
jgi:hypothetical protein